MYFWCVAWPCDDSFMGGAHWKYVRDQAAIISDTLCMCNVSLIIKKVFVISLVQ